MTRVTVAAFTPGLVVPSARYRVRQHVPALATLGVDVTEYYTGASAYPPPSRWARPGWLAANMAVRLTQVIGARHHDVTWLQREFVSTLVTLEGLTPAPRVLDVDDAVFTHARGGFARKLAQLCQVGVCGNAFLADWFGQYIPRIHIVPTAVDTDALAARQAGPDGPGRIGWVGTVAGFGYLERLAPAIARVLDLHPGAEFVVCSSEPFRTPALDGRRVRFVPWSPDGEPGLIRSFTVGIMPLIDGPLERGKCSYKMLTFMSCGVPVVVSPVGMNVDVLSQGEVGYAARSDEEWVATLDLLLRDRDLADRLGRDGRRVAETHYSNHAIAPRLAAILREAAA
jgi:glycosyltransferase involved in cell wall biosynthesis